VVLSWPVVGSSKKSTAGSESSSIATDTRRFSPPEIPRTNALPTMVCCWRTSLSRCSTVATRLARVAADPGTRSLAWNSRHSFTDSKPGKMSSWTT